MLANKGFKIRGCHSDSVTVQVFQILKVVSSEN
jgi:hypothetical protein